MKVMLQTEEDKKVLLTLRCTDLARWNIVALTIPQDQESLYLA